LEISLDITSKIKKFEDNSAVYRDLMAKRKADGIKAEKKPIISVIVPCYNVEKYIDRCMESIVRQTIGIENLQVIIVDNASTDSTLEMMREWEKKFPKNILIITYNENICPGGARNIGMCYADAEYMCFMDSDDWADLDMYEIFYDRIKEKRWDVVKCKYERDSNYILRRNDSDIDIICYEFESKNGFYRGEISNTGKNGALCYVWGGVYLSKVIFENDVWFVDKIQYEDNYWLSVLRLYTKNMCIVDKCLYHYWYDESSISSKRNSEEHFDVLYVEILILEEYKKRGVFELFCLELEYEFIQDFYLETMHKIFTLFDYIPDVFGFMKETIYSYFPNFRNEVDISSYAKIHQILIKLLYIEGDITPEFLGDLKGVYLKFWNENIRLWEKIRGYK